MSAMRVVLDTNTVLSALLFGRGRLAWLRQVWQEGEICPLVSDVTAAEIRRVLSYPKFRLSEVEQMALLSDYLPFCESVTIPEPPPVVPDCRDLQDVPFLWLAIVGQAEYLITGDRDLLVLADEFVVPMTSGRSETIVTAAVFRSVIQP